VKPNATPDDIRTAVRSAYGEIASASRVGCGCGCAEGTEASQLATKIGYASSDVVGAPAAANLGLGCGNPVAIASLREGETVVDLGSGAGFDCFLAARQVGESGRVIGVDMTPEMVTKARENAAAAGVTNVSFRLGEIEHLPVADATADVIISNCVINLSPEKSAVLNETFRVLRSGGRLAIADVIAVAPLPEPVLLDVRAYTGCVSGGVSAEVMESMLEQAGFVDILITPKGDGRGAVREPSSGASLEDYVTSALIEARKP
jgi:arsenite methyltransferase